MFKKRVSTEEEVKLVAKAIVGNIKKELNSLEMAYDEDNQIDAFDEFKKSVQCLTIETPYDYNIINCLDIVTDDDDDDGTRYFEFDTTTYLIYEDNTVLPFIDELEVIPSNFSKNDHLEIIKNADELNPYKRNDKITSHIGLEEILELFALTNKKHGGKELFISDKDKIKEYDKILNKIWESKNEFEVKESVLFPIVS